jgi:shikimate kinase
MNNDAKIILIGYRCTGKTTVGKGLAARLGIPFIDTDTLVEKAAGKTIREMTEESGWPFFRAKEREAIKSLISLGKSVVAPGGGAVMDEENAALLKKEGIMIWLMASEKTILQRMTSDAATFSQRPRFSNQELQEEIRETLSVRTPIYSSLADFSVDTDVLNIDEVIDRICHFLAEHEKREII